MRCRMPRPMRSGTSVSLMHSPHKACFRCGGEDHTQGKCTAPQPTCDHCKFPHLTRFHEAAKSLHQAMKRRRETGGGRGGGGREGRGGGGGSTAVLGGAAAALLPYVSRKTPTLF
jgi:hypothetical protein